MILPKKLGVEATPKNLNDLKLQNANEEKKAKEILEAAQAFAKDLESKSAIWREGDTLYYPLGLLDPDYCVLRFTAESGRFYSKFRSEDFALA